MVFLCNDSKMWFNVQVHPFPYSDLSIGWILQYALDFICLSFYFKLEIKDLVKMIKIVFSCNFKSSLLISLGSCLFPGFWLRWVYFTLSLMDVSKKWIICMLSLFNADIHKYTSDQNFASFDEKKMNLVRYFWINNGCFCHCVDGFKYFLSFNYSNWLEHTNQ